MGMSLDRTQIEDLVIYCGSSPTRWKNGNMQICCPVHGESNPSMGVSEDKQKCHCFSCGFAGSFSKLLYHSLPDEFGYDQSTKEKKKKTWFKAERLAREFLVERYELEYREFSKAVKNLRRYEDLAEKDIITLDATQSIPMFKIAPFQSGLATYKYYFNRGFTREEMKKFMVGYDEINKTVTLPVFNQDGTLSGIIGRYIDKNRKHNERYKIYDGFERGKTLYPLNLFEPCDDTIIGVEGQFDAQIMHRYGYSNALARMTNKLTVDQAKWIGNHCKTYIDFGDNDKRGIQAMDSNYELLKGMVKYQRVTYPEYGKDPCDWTEEDIENMIVTAHSPLVRKIRRIE